MSSDPATLRVVGYGFDAEPAFVGEWTQSPDTLLRDLNLAVDDHLDWVYFEEQGVGQVAFFGGAPDLPSVDDYFEDRFGRKIRYLPEHPGWVNPGRNVAV